MSGQPTRDHETIVRFTEEEDCVAGTPSDATYDYLRVEAEQTASLRKMEARSAALNYAIMAVSSGIESDVLKTARKFHLFLSDTEAADIVSIVA